MKNSDSLSLPVIWIVSVTRQFQFLRQLTAPYSDRAIAIPVDVGLDLDGIDALVARLQTERCDAIIASGTHAALLQQRLSTPVVTAAASGFDLMHALAKARKLSSSIGVLTYRQPVDELDDFARTFGCDITQMTYVDVDNAYEQIIRMRQAGVGAVIGSGFVTELAFEAGLQGVYAFSESSVQRLWESAMAAATETQAQAQFPDATLVQAIALYSRAPATQLYHGDTAMQSAQDRDVESFVAVHCDKLARSLREQADSFSF